MALHHAAQAPKRVSTFMIFDERAPHPACSEKQAANLCKTRARPLLRTFSTSNVRSHPPEFAASVVLHRADGTGVSMHKGYAGRCEVARASFDRQRDFADLELFSVRPLLTPRNPQRKVLKMLGKADSTHLLVILFFLGIFSNPSETQGP